LHCICIADVGIWESLWWICTYFCTYEKEKRPIGHPRTFNRARTRQRDTIYKYLHSRRQDNLLDINPEKSATKYRHHGCLASRGQLLGHDMSMLSLHPIHCYYCITCTTITPSHALILFHHMHCYYFLTCTAIASSHALILLHHMYCY
jgi:hypothetical protein